MIAATSKIAPAIVIELCAELINAEAHLNALDRAIGDGDHGSNLVRAAAALTAAEADLAALPTADAIRSAGKQIAMSVGGASGPLYGTLLMEMGKALPDPVSPADWAEAFTQGVAAVARRGKSSEGEKTMLDVLTPAARALANAVKAAQPLAAALNAMIRAAEDGLTASRLLRATRGRAAYVGDRSIGADDPGATSALLCLHIIAHQLIRENA